MMSENGSIFSIPELRLCMNLSGYIQWDDLPLVETVEPAEQRTMNAFLHLVHCHRFLPGTEGYEMEPHLAKMIRIIGEAEKIAHLCVDEQIVAFLYLKNGHIVVIEPDLGHADHCKLYCIDGMSFEEVVRQAGMWEDGMQLHPGKHLTASTDRNDLSRLALYLTNNMRTEENE